MPKEWPLEGHFECGGQGGLLVTPDCLGREFTSRTANHDLIIGMPQLDTRPKHGSLRAPQWTYGDQDEDEDWDEDEDREFWGFMLPEIMGILLSLFSGSTVPEGGEAAHVLRCRFYTSLTASTDEEFDAAADDFAHELEDWWTRFTSWVSILTSQDFLRLGGQAGLMTNKNWQVETWTSNADGQRARDESRGYKKGNRIQTSPLEVNDLQACVTATGNQGAPPAEWLFIRDARSLLNGGENRRAVIEAATAAELAMATLINQYFATANTDELVRTALTERYRALEGRTQLLTRLRSGLPKRLEHDLIKPRNSATHAGHPLTDEQALTAVDMAVTVVEAAYPLASLLPTQ